MTPSAKYRGGAGMLRGVERVTIVEGGVCTCIYVVTVFCDLATHLMLIESPIVSPQAGMGLRY